MTPEIPETEVKTSPDSIEEEFDRPSGGSPVEVELRRIAKEDAAAAAAAAAPPDAERLDNVERQRERREGGKDKRSEAFTVERWMTDPERIDPLTVTEPDPLEAIAKRFGMGITALGYRVKEMVLSEEPHIAEAGLVIQKLIADAETLIDPIMNPVDAFVGGFVGGGKFAGRVGIKGFAKLRRALYGGASAVAVEAPVGLAIEGVAKEHPLLAFPFALAIGFIVGGTIELGLERGLFRGERAIVNLILFRRAAKIKAGVNPSLAAKLALREALQDSTLEETTALANKLREIEQQTAAPTARKGPIEIGEKVSTPQGEGTVVRQQGKLLMVEMDAGGKPRTFEDVEVGRKPTEPAVVEAGGAQPFVLPKGLAKASPRYSYQHKKFTLVFEDDLDRALYIVADGARRSKRDGEFMELLKAHTGLGEDEIRRLGREVRTYIKGRAKIADPGELVIPGASKADAPVVGRKPLEVVESEGEGGVRRFTFFRDGVEVGNSRLLGETIGDVEVLETFRRQGIGKQIIGEMRARGGTSATEGSPEGRALLLSAGFKETPPGSRSFSFQEVGKAGSKLVPKEEFIAGHRKTIEELEARAEELKKAGASMGRTGFDPTGEGGLELMFVNGEIGNSLSSIERAIKDPRKSIPVAVEAGQPDIPAAKPGGVLPETPALKGVETRSREEADRLALEFHKEVSKRLSPGEVEKLNDHFSFLKEQGRTPETDLIVSKSFIALDRPIRVFRGASSEAFLSSGKFVSTSLDRESASIFASPATSKSPVLVQIDIQPGVKITAPSPEFTAAEIVLSKNVEFQVIRRGKTMVGQGNEIDFLEVVARPKRGATPPAPALDPTIKITKATPEEIKRFVETDPSTVRVGEHHVLKVDWSAIGDHDEISGVIKKISAFHAKHIDEARRNVLTDKAVKELADELGMTPEALLSRRAGEAFNAEETRATMELLGASSNNLRAISRRVEAGDPSAVAEMGKAHGIHVRIQEVFWGVRAEWGRTGRILQQDPDGTLTYAKRIAQLIEEAQEEGSSVVLNRVRGTKPGIKPVDLAKAILDMPSNAELARFARKLARPGGVDMFFELWYAGILGLHTTVLNVVANTAFAFESIAERAVAGRLSRGGGVEVGEATVKAYGLVSSFMDGIRAAAKAWKTGASDFGPEKFMEGLPPAIRGEHLDLTGVAGRAVDAFGYFTRTISRSLLAGDAFAKRTMFRAEAHALSYRKAISEGLKGRDLAERMAELMDDLPPSLKAAAEEEALYRSFTKELGKFGKGVQDFAKHPMGRIILPFVRISVNLGNAAFDFVPPIRLAELAVVRGTKPFYPKAWTPLKTRFTEDIAAGGARRDNALAKLSLGSMMMMTAAVLTAAGRITGGGPKDKDLRRQWLETHQPYSIMIGGKWRAYGRLDPIGMIIGLSADYTYMVGKMDRVSLDGLVKAAGIAVAKNIFSKNYMRGLTEFLNAAMDPEARLPRMAGQFISSLVPFGATFRAANRAFNDDAVREVRGLFDKALASIPGLSDKLPPSRNLFAEVRFYEGGFGPDFVTPFYQSTPSKHPVDIELVSLEVGFSMPPRSIEGVELNAEEYDRFVVLAGKELTSRGGLSLKPLLAKLFKSTRYKRLNDGGKALMIRARIRSLRKRAVAKLLGEGEFSRKEPEAPDLAALVNKARQEKRESRGLSDKLPPGYIRVGPNIPGPLPYVNLPGPFPPYD